MLMSLGRQAGSGNFSTPILANGQGTPFPGLAWQCPGMTQARQDGHEAARSGRGRGGAGSCPSLHSTEHATGRGVTEHMLLRELEFLWPKRTPGELRGLSVALPELLLPCCYSVEI